eukprot:3812317-Amphidinium_carterae.1
MAKSDSNRTELTKLPEAQENICFLKLSHPTRTNQEVYPARWEPLSTTELLVPQRKLHHTLCALPTVILMLIAVSTTNQL